MSTVIICELVALLNLSLFCMNLYAFTKKKKKRKKEKKIMLMKMKNPELTLW